MTLEGFQREEIFLKSSGKLEIIVFAALVADDFEEYKFRTYVGLGRVIHFDILTSKYFKTCDE